MAWYALTIFDALKRYMETEGSTKLYNYMPMCMKSYKKIIIQFNNHGSNKNKALQFTLPSSIYPSVIQYAPGLLDAITTEDLLSKQKKSKITS